MLRQVVSTKLNVEMAATAEMTTIAGRIKPEQVTLVPERPNELTTEGGLDVLSNAASVGDAVKRLRAAGIKVSVFIDPDVRQVAACREAGADAIEPLLAQVFGRQPDARMHEEAAHAHALKDTHLAAQFLGLQFAVPGPEGFAAIGARRLLENLLKVHDLPARLER
jgi:pyridoxine 5-phosphate synthase